MCKNDDKWKSERGQNSRLWDEKHSTKNAKIIGISLSCKRAIQNELNFRTTTFRILAVLKLLKTQRLSI